MAKNESSTRVVVVVANRKKNVDEPSSRIDPISPRYRRNR